VTYTLSHSIRHGIALTMHGPYNSPFTITQTGTIFPSYNKGHDNAGVFSSLTGAAAPTLVNQGLIWDDNYFSSSVRFTGGGTILNDGSIRTNDGYAINIGYGLVTNASPTALITGYNAGVKITGSGNILNQSTIGGRYYGITLGTGAITNTAGGFISAYYNAIRTGDSSTITNEGGSRIFGGVNAIQMGANGAITNTGSASIAAGETGIQMGAYGQITNTGGAKIYGGNFGGIEMGAHGAITNAAGATIAIHNNNAIAMGASGYITNGGIIFGNIQMAAYAVITNATAGTIDGAILIGANNSLTNSGTLINDGTISGPVEFLSPFGSITNAGLIAGGIALDGGQVVNDGTISGGVKLVSAYGSITNAGLISGNVVMQNGALANTGKILAQVEFLSAYGSITNAGSMTGGIEMQGGIVSNSNPSSLIYGMSGGINSTGPTTTFNAGTIKSIAASTPGISFGAGGTIINDGLISGREYGVALNGGTVVNDGTISGEVELQGSTSNLLVFDAGAIFNGAVIASKSASNTLELAEGNDTLSGLGSNFSGFQTITFDSGAAWQLGGNAVAFSNATILNFTAKDTIAISDIFVHSPTTLTLNAHGVLEIPESSTQTLAITFATANTGATFQLSPDRNGGVELTIEPSGPPTGAITLNPATPKLTLTTNIDTFGIIGTYGIETNHAFTAYPIGAALFAAPGTSFNVINRAHIESDSTAPYNAGIVLESASKFTNGGTIVAATGIEVLGLVTGAYIETNKILRATLGAGIYLQAKGSGLNTGQLTAATTGILLAGGGYAYNSGTIHAAATGIDQAGGDAYNYGAITAATAIRLTGTAGYVDNTGNLRAAQDGIDFETSGSVSNTGTIQAQSTGLLITTGGIAHNTGFISAANGIILTHGGTIIESGTLIGATYAASFATNTANRFVLAPTATIIGTVSGGGGILELAHATTIGTIALGSTQFTNFATLEIDPLSKWDLSGTFTAPSITNNGTIIESPKDLATFAFPITGTGTIKLSKQPLTIENSIAASQKIAFTGTDETLALTTPQNFAATITNFALTDTIDLTGISLSAITGMHFGNAALTLTESSGILAFYFAAPGEFGKDLFTLTAAGPGTAITLEKPAASSFPTPLTPSSPPPLITLQT